MVIMVIMVTMYCIDTIADMVRHAAVRFGEKTAIAFTGTSLTFRQLEEDYCRFGHLMQQYGIEKGDTGHKIHCQKIHQVQYKNGNYALR